MERVYTLRPGYLVQLRTAIDGNVDHEKEEIEAPHLDSDGVAIVSAWNTRRTVKNPEEYKLATQVRGRIRNIITRVCSTSSYGLLCRFDMKDKLDAAIVTARALAAEFNAQAEITEISVYTLLGQVSSSDAEAMRAINRDVRDMMDSMTEGLKEANADKIRDAVKRAKAIEGMLTEDASERVKQAIAVARAGANRIVKSGEVAAGEVDKATLDVIKRSRTSFLDLSDAGEITAPTHTARAVDLAPDCAADIVMPSLKNMLVKLDLADAGITEPRNDIPLPADGLDAAKGLPVTFADE